MKLKNPLGLFNSLREKLMKDTLEGAAESAMQYLETLDLDKDGESDLQEIRGFLTDLQKGVQSAVGSVNGEQVVKFISALEALAAAGSALMEVSKSVLDTEQAKEAQKQLTDAIKKAAQYAKDVAEATQKAA